MGERRDNKKLTEAIVDAWHFEHRFNEKFHKREDFNKSASAELRQEVDWLLKTTKQLRSKRPIEYDADAKEFSKRAKRALEDIEDTPPSERSFAGGGWSPPKKSGFLPNFLGLCLVGAAFFWLFDYCGPSTHEGSERNGGERRVRYR